MGTLLYAVDIENHRNGPKKEMQSIRTDVVHVRQSYSWDCGLACSKMVLRTYCMSDTSVVNDICQKYKIGESVWTIDLAYILKECGLKLSMYTLTLGADQTYAKESFYVSNFTNDEGRVNRLFSVAAEHDIEVQKRSVPMTEITDHLMTSGLVIVLIDWAHLSCVECKEKSGLLSVFSSCLKSLYQGHFIVLCGFDEEQEIVYYHNPSYQDILCYCSYETLDKARQQYGTDEDIVFIHHPDS